MTRLVPGALIWLMGCSTVPVTGRQLIPVYPGDHRCDTRRFRGNDSCDEDGALTKRTDPLRHANSYGDGRSLLVYILREGLGPMPPAITARRSLDYRIVTGLVGLLFFGLILVPPFGGAHNWRLSVVGAVVFGLVLYRQIDRLRFSKSRVEFVNPFGVVVAFWPLDGTSRVSFDEVVTQSRWGRAVRGSLVVKGGSGMALALTRGRYTKEPQWSEFLLGQENLGRVLISDEAREHLRANLEGDAETS